MHNPSTVPRWAQVLVGMILAAIALSALKVDVVNNYEYGSQISPELATVMVIAAVCVGALPAIAAVFGWSWLLGSLTAICVLMTCWSAVNAYASKMGAEILTKTGQAAQYAGAEQDQAAARATLSRIKETADTQTLERLISESRKGPDTVALERRIAEARKNAEAQEAGDTRKMGTQSCFKYCREAKAAIQALIDRLGEAKARDGAAHTALLDRLSEAKARDGAKAELAKAKTEARAGPAEASMVATWIAARTARDAVDIARTIALVMTFGGIVVTQCAALLAHMAARFIFGGIKGATPPEPETVRAPARPAAHVPTHGRISEAEAFDHLQRKMRAAPNRIYRGSGHALADEIGLAHSTHASWVKHWVEEGRIETRRQGRMTEFCFPSTPRLRRVV